MTAPEPRLDEIEARLSAAPAHVANARFGDVLRIVWTTYYFGADLQWHNARSGDVENAETLAEEIEASEGDWGWMTAPADVAFLLAELRKAREALADAGAKALEEAADAVAAQRDATNPDRTPDEAWSVVDHRDGRFLGKTVAIRWLRARAAALRGDS